MWWVTSTVKLGFEAAGKELIRRAGIVQSRSDRPLRRFVPHIQERTIARGRNSASAFPGRAIQR